MNDKKDVKLLKKMIIQILICITIYFVFYIIQNNQYVFSDDFINKANEILSYDTNFMELYEIVKNNVMTFINKDEQNKEQLQQEEIPKDEDKQNEVQGENQEQKQEENQNQEQNQQNDAIGG